MHNFAKKIMECVKAKVDGIGVDNIEGQHLEELKSWSCIAKDIAEYDYYYNIVKAMEESDAEYGVDYDENGLKHYNVRRNSMGRYMRGYEDGMRMAMNDHTYNNKMMDDRKMDYENGKMHYTEPNHHSEYDRTRRMYTEAKMMNPADKQKHLDALNKNIDVVSKDFKAMKSDMSPEERQTLKTRLMNMANEM